MARAYTFDIDLNPIVVYHDDCPDGITALWVCRQKWPNCEAYPARYEVPPDLGRLSGRFVIVVDFSWKRVVMQTVLSAAAVCVVFDHHKSAQAELEGLDGCLFDMDRSGCGLIWDELFQGCPRPAIVDYTEDRDLWRFAFPRSREINAAYGTYPLTIETRTDLARLSSTHIGITSLAREGETILRYRKQLISDVVSKGIPIKHIGGHRVPCVASPFRELVSELTHELAKGYSFAATYYDDGDEYRHFSLRSTVDGIDVSEVARKYGGGGHQHAAGFSSFIGLTRSPSKEDRLAHLIDGAPEVG